MDGRMAVLFALISSVDSISHYKDDSFYSKKPTLPFVSASLGQTIFQEQNNTKEIGLDYHFNYTYGSWLPMVSFSATDKTGLWLGYGASISKGFSLGSVFFYGKSFFAPGVYYQGDDVNLGLPIEFKSGIEAGVRIGKRFQFGVSYDHRSNGDFSKTNPGLESTHYKLYYSF